MKEAGYVITASCGKKEMSDEEYSQLGLTSSHAYSVLGAKIRENQPFVILRNPWGNTAWKEDNNNLINDRKGLFWMNFNDFLVYFYSIDVCKLNYKLHEKRLGAYFSKEKTISFKLEFKETSQVDISLFYKCKHRKETNNLGISFVVIKIGGIGVLAQSKTTYEKFVSLELVLEPGQYLIIPMCLKTFVQNKDSTFCSYNLVVHSTKTFQMEEKSYGITLLVDILSACCKLNKQKLDDAQSKKFSVYKLWTGYMYILVAENLSKNKYLRIELNFNESKNVASTRDELKTLDYIPPGHRQLLHVITPDDVNGGCKIILTNKTFKLKNYLLTKLVMLKIFNKKEKKLIELHSPQSLMI
jgi:calpain-15